MFEQMHNVLVISSTLVMGTMWLSIAVLGIAIIWE
jgi:hypothetical protein